MKILLGAHVSIAGGLKNACAHARVQCRNNDRLKVTGAVID